MSVEYIIICDICKKEHRRSENASTSRRIYENEKVVLDMYTLQDGCKKDVDICDVCGNQIASFVDSLREP